MYDKDKMISNFSGVSDSYDEAALFQRKAASVLADFMHETGHVPMPGDRILELGCGTGIFSEQLAQLSPEACFTFTDISPEMLSVCREKLENRRLHASFELCDMESSGGFGHWDCIASALAFQWSREFRHMLLRLNDALAESGLMAFSTLADGTFEDLRNIFAEENVTYPAPALLPEEIILEAVSCSFPENTYKFEKIEIEFSNLHQLFRNFKLTGTGNSSGKPIGPGALRRVFRRAEKFYKERGKVSVIYNTGFFCCVKNSSTDGFEDEQQLF